MVIQDWLSAASGSSIRLSVNPDTVVLQLVSYMASKDNDIFLFLFVFGFFSV